MTGVSVVIPVYNGAAFLSRTITSVLLQSMPADQVIIVDDGSKDESLGVAQGFGSRLQIVRQRNGGVAQARNRGLSLAEGRFVAFLDQDDVWHPNFLERLAHVLKAEPTVAGVFGNGNFIDDTGTELSVMHRHPIDPTLDVLIDGNPFFSPSQALLQKGALQSVGGFDETLTGGADDWDVWLKLLLAGYGLAYVSEAVMQYRLHSSQGHRSIELMVDSEFAVLEKILQHPAVSAKVGTAVNLHKAKHYVDAAVRASGYRQIALAINFLILAAKLSPESLASGSVPTALLYSALTALFGERRFWRIKHGLNRALSAPYARRSTTQ